MVDSKMLTFFSKFAGLQYSWIKRLFDNSFHQWKGIPLYLVRWYSGKNFKFHSYLEISRFVLGNFPKFYQELFLRWGKYISSPVTLLSTVTCQCILFNKHTQIDNKSICFHSLSNNDLNFVCQHFDFDGSIKSWKCLNDQFRIKDKMQFQCYQIKHALPKLQKDNIKNFSGNLNNFSIQDHHLIKCHRIVNLEKLNSRELCKSQLSLNYEKPICQAYHEKKFGNYNFDWKISQGIPRIATYNTKILIFQYKLLNNVSYLNQKLYQFGFVCCSKCSFCDIHDETPLHIFPECVYA